MDKSTKTALWVVVILGAAGLLTGVIKLPSGFVLSIPGVQGPAGTTSPTGVTITSSGGGTSCPSGIGQFVQVQQQYIDFTKNPAKATLAAVVGNVYVPGVAQPANTFTTLTSGYLQWPGTSSPGAGCNVAYGIVTGDNTNYYLNWTNVNTGTNLNTYVTVTSLKYSAANAQATNAISNALSANILYGAVSAGQTVTAIQVAIQAANNWYGNGPGAGHGYLVIFSFNSPDITSVNIPGAQPYTGALPPPNFFAGQSAVSGAQNTRTAYLFPSIYYNQFGTPSGGTATSATFTPIIQVGANYATPVNEFIGLDIVPLTTFVYNGNPVYNTAVDNTGAALFATVTNKFFISLKYN